MPSHNSRPNHRPAAVGMVGLDLDGTVVEKNGAMPDGVLEVIQELRAAGVAVIPATGRPVQAVVETAADAGMDRSWAVCSNGAVRAKIDASTAPGYRVENRETFDARRTLDTLSALLPQAFVAVEDGERGLLVNRPFPVGDLTRHERVVPREDLVAGPVSRVSLYVEGMSGREMAEILSAADLGGVLYNIGWTAWLDVTPPGVSKASELEHVRRLLGVPPEGTVAIGDGENDIEMLSWASRGVAMGGSAPAVLDAASEVTGTVGDGGLVTVLEDVLRHLG